MTRTTSWKIFWTVYKLQESLPNIADSHFLSIDHHSQDKKHYSDRRDPNTNNNTQYSQMHINLLIYRQTWIMSFRRYRT